MIWSVVILSPTFIQREPFKEEGRAVFLGGSPIFGPLFIPSDSFPGYMNMESSIINESVYCTLSISQSLSKGLENSPLIALQAAVSGLTR